MTKRAPRDAAAADFAQPWAELAAQGAAMMFRLPVACALFDVEGAAKERLAHVPSRGVLHLQLLEMEGRRREELEVADVIVVQVRDDDVAYFLRAHVQ